MKSFEAIKQARGRPGTLGVNTYLVVRDTELPDEIAVYQAKGWVLFRMKSKENPMWPRKLASFDGKINGNLKLHSYEISSIPHDVKKQLGLDFGRISVNEYYVGNYCAAGFVDLAD